MGANIGPEQPWKPAVFSKSSKLCVSCFPSPALPLLVLPRFVAAVSSLTSKWGTWLPLVRGNWSRVQTSSSQRLRLRCAGCVVICQVKLICPRITLFPLALLLEYAPVYGPGPSQEPRDATVVSQRSDYEIVSMSGWFNA